MNNNTKITVMLTINKMIIGGAEQQFLELVKGLDKTRFKAIVVTFYSGGDLEPEIKKVKDIEYICLDRKSKYNFSALFAIFRLLRQWHVDVIQPLLTPATFFTLLPAVMNRIPVKIVTERGNARRKPGLGYNLYLRTEDFFTRFADWVIPNSGSGKDYLIKRGISPGQIKVIYNGINLQRLVPDQAKVTKIRAAMEIPEDGLIVGISASLTANKDHATFLRAAKIVSETMPGAKFAILGEGPLKTHLLELTRELGIESKVIFLGNRTDVADYIAAFDIACLSSSLPEGCSNSILEAMALGKPVVATDTGGNNELVKNGDNGLIVPVQNPQKMAEAILSCLQHPALSREMGQRGKYMTMTRFSVKRMVEDYESLYQDSIMAKRKPDISNKVN